jgi:HK97 gp10 family phage protein
MAEVVTVKITGLAELTEKLERMPLKVAKRILRNALKPAGELWRAEMVARVRRGPHHLKGAAEIFAFLAKNILLRATVTSDLTADVKVGPSKNAFWSRFLEFGTRIRHRGRKSGGLRRGASTGIMPDFPFIRPAYETMKHQVLDKFIEGVREAFRAEGTRLR